MSNQKISMTNLKLLLQRLSNGDSVNMIKDSLHMSKKTVIKYKNKAKETGLSYQSLLVLSDPELSVLLQPEDSTSASVDEKYKVLEPLLEGYATRLSRGRYVNILSLWEEYEMHHKDDSCGYYQYTQFKHYLNEYAKSNDYSYINNYIAGREWQIDFAGDSLSITDIKTSERTPVVLLVCIMPYSNLTFAWAMENMRQELFFDGLNRGLIYMGALPRVARSDNMKQWMKKYDKYEPDYADENSRWCLHYDMMPESCRPRHPRDKGPVESAVNQIYRYIYARIEEEIFYTLPDLNNRLMQLLDEFNSRKMRGREMSRWDLFLQEEKPLMRELPDQMYSFRYSKTVKLGPSYHVYVGSERHRYSVPCKYVNQDVKVLWNLESVEIYVRGIRVATHMRSMVPHAVTTVEEHMPEKHQAYKRGREMNAGGFLEWAEKIGPETRWAVQYLLERYQFPEHSYPSCLGVMSIAKKYGDTRLENACKLLHGELMYINLKTLRNVLDNNRDKCISMEHVSDIPKNTNVRGAENYKTNIISITNNE